MTKIQQALREWRVLHAVWSDADYNGTTKNVVQKGTTRATNEEMARWTGNDADLTIENMYQYSGNGIEEGSYTLQVLEAERWEDVMFFALNSYICKECRCEFEAIASSEEENAPDLCDQCKFEHRIVAEGNPQEAEA